jgi:putative ABC transport system ATP-binding protein
MLEFKNVKVTLQGNSTSKPFSLVVAAGEVVCLCGGAGTGKTGVLRAILGLSPLAGGYITVDGELVTPGASAYFRKMTSYVPQSLPDVRMTVGELCGKVLAMQTTSEQAPAMEALAGQLKRWGFDDSVRNQHVTQLSPQQMQQVMLIVALLQEKPILLVDNPPHTQAVQALLHELAAQGKEVVYTCRENRMQCHQIVNI